MPEAVRDHEGALKKYSAALEKHREADEKHSNELRALQQQTTEPDLPPKTRAKLGKQIKDLIAKAPKPPAKPMPRMQELEIPLMLTLATSLKLLLGTSTTPAQWQRGAELLYRYLKDFKGVWITYLMS